MSKREGVHRVKGYSIVVLTGTDALRLDTTERPYSGLHVSVATHLVLTGRGLLTYGTVSLYTLAGTVFFAQLDKFRYIWRRNLV